MKVFQTKIKGVLIIEPDVFKDKRGWFTESYNKKEFKKFGINANFKQDNYSFSRKKGTLRGLHFQNKPNAQAKLVFCAKGAVLDVVVDLRKNSLTYKKWICIKLTEKNRKLVLIPRGFAHGFLSLADNTEFYYKVDFYYNKESERTIYFNDPELAINWGIKNPILSIKDKEAPLLADCDIDL